MLCVESDVGENEIIEVSEIAVNLVEPIEETKAAPKKAAAKKDEEAPKKATKKK